MSQMHGCQCLMTATRLPLGTKAQFIMPTPKAVAHAATSRLAREAGPQIRKMVCVKKCINSAAVAASCVGL